MNRLKLLSAMKLALKAMTKDDRSYRQCFLDTGRVVTFGHVKMEIQVEGLEVKEPFFVNPAEAIAALKAFTSEDITIMEYPDYIEFMDASVSGVACIQVQRYEPPSIKVYNPGIGFYTFKLTHDDLEFIKKAKHLASNDDLRPGMTGMMVDLKNRVIGFTDAHAMAIRRGFGRSTARTGDDAPLKGTIQSKHVELILQAKQARVWMFNNGCLEIEITELEQDASATIATIYGKFDSSTPDFVKVFDEPGMAEAKGELFASKYDFLSYIKRLKPMSNPSTNQIELHVDPGHTTQLVAKNHDSNMSATMYFNEGKYISEKGEIMKIGFNANVMTKALKAASGELVVSLVAPHRALIINGNILVMPLMLNEND